MIYKEKLNKLTLSIPIEVAEWTLQKGDLSEFLREILDQKMSKKTELFVPDYKKSKRPTRGRPRKDEDPNYIPPVKRPRGRPPKSKEEKV